MLAYYLIKLCSSFLCIAPKCIRNLVASFLGGIAMLVVPDWRMKMARTNIMECLGVDEHRAYHIADMSLRRFGRMVVEVLRFPTLTKENIGNLVKIEGLEYLDACYRAGRGVIMATGHFGNWELLGGTVALLGYPMLSITRRQNNRYMDKLINEYRQMVGQEVAYNRGEGDFLAISRMLRKKKLIGVLFDQDTNDVGVKVNIFGKPSIIPMGSAALSRLHGSPILPIFLHNNDDGTCSAKIYPPIYAEKTEDKEKDYYRATEQMVRILEQEIIMHPEMWFWVHDRWKDGRKRFKK